MGRYKVDYEAGDLIPLEEVMVGATSSTAGIGGIVPSPAAHHQYRLLGGDGTWQKGNFVGTRKEWNNLTKEEKLQFKTADIYKKQCTITYKANNGIEEDIVEGPIIEGSKYIVSTNSFTAPVDMMFWYWNTQQDGSGINYKPGDEINIDDDLTLWAVWDWAALKFSSDDDFILLVGNPSWNGTLEYTLNNGNNWFAWNGSELNGTATQPIYIRGTGKTVIAGSSTYKWTFTGKYCTGNIETLLDYQTVTNGQHPTMGDYCYQCMFENCTSLINPPELPATTLANYCYAYMFKGCTSLTTPPQLPATTLADHCYFSMFNNCTSLTTSPELPAITLANNCYSSMFIGCTSLTILPELPATTLANYCYGGMFAFCTSLTTAPELPATILKEGCYRGMFNGCTSLTTLPNLPATALTVECYLLMFQECTSIKLSTTQIGEYQYAYRIPKSGTGTTATDALTDMFINTGGTFKGTPTINTTYYTDHQPV